MEIDIEVDPLSGEGTPTVIAHQLNFLRLALGEVELEARRRVLECVATGKKVLRLRELGSFVGSEVRCRYILLGNIPMHIPRQDLLDIIIIDLNKEQYLDIDLIDAAQRISDEAWVFQREGLWCSMALKLEEVLGFCDFGDLDEGLKPVCGFAYSRLYAPQPDEHRGSRNAPPYPPHMYLHGCT